MAGAGGNAAGAGAGGANGGVGGGAAQGGALNGGASGSGAGGDATGGGGSSGMGGAGGTSNEQPSVHFVGRVDTSDPSNVRFAWSGSGVVAQFSGTSIAVRLDGGQQYTVLIDGQLQPKLIPSMPTSVLASDLAEGTHVVEIYRRTEANQGESIFSGFDLGTGTLLAPPPAPERRIEIIGDSITCGYGNEGADMNCPFTPDTENHYLTYGAIAAREVGAELSTVAWSGKGVVCNYGDEPASCTDPLPVYYDRTLPDRPESIWSFASWQPHAVVINLGSNDLSTASDPSQVEFETAYGAFLERIRAAYPDALILCTLGPGEGGDHAVFVGYIQNAVQARVAQGDTKVKSFMLPAPDANDGFGCDWHPSLRTHERMAEALAAALRAELGW